jgi:cytochrome c-type biogenesis protein CcmH
MTRGKDRSPRDETSSTTPSPSRAEAARDNEPGPTPTRGVRTVILSVVALIGLAALAVGTLLFSIGPSEKSGPGIRPGAAVSRTAPDASKEISGTISVAPELRGRASEGETLFIIARKGPGAPFAVQRISGPRFPLAYRLGPQDVMAAGTPFEGEVSVSARLSQTGVAGPAQPGDLEGEHAGRVLIGSRDVNIVLARVD